MAIPVKNDTIKQVKALLRELQGNDYLTPSQQVRVDEALIAVEADENEQLLEEMRIDGDLPEPKSGAWIV